MTAGPHAFACASPALGKFGVELSPPDAGRVVVGLPPWRRMMIRRGPCSCSPAALFGADGTEVERRAVLPEPLEFVEGALLVVLDVDDDVAGSR